MSDYRTLLADGIPGLRLPADAIAGVLTALERPWRYVTPQRWTKDLAVSRDKGAHREMAMRLFPGDAHLFQRVKDDGRADAALLAWWGLKQ